MESVNNIAFCVLCMLTCAKNQHTRGLPSAGIAAVAQCRRTSCEALRQPNRLVNTLQIDSAVPLQLCRRCFESVTTTDGANQLESRAALSIHHADEKAVHMLSSVVVAAVCNAEFIAIWCSSTLRSSKNRSPAVRSTRTSFG